MSLAERRVLWQKQRRGEIAAASARKSVIVLPIGAVEQHGPHLPLDTDSSTALTISVMAADQIDDFTTLVLPPVWWGLSPYWMSFPGTLTLRPETIISMILDLSQSVARHGFRRLVILNGHGGNDGLMEAAAVNCSTESIRVAATSYWKLIPDKLLELAPEDGGQIGHAGAVETSIQLFLQPELVDQSAIQAADCLDLTGGPRELDAVYMPPDPEHEAPVGIYGHALMASRDKGEQLVEIAARRLAAFIRHFQAM